MSDIVLLFGNVKGTSEVLTLSCNTDFEIQRPSSQKQRRALNWTAEVDEFLPPFFQLRFGENIESPGGWIYGSADAADFQIASNNKIGVGARHFNIDVTADAFCPRITNLHKNPIRIFVEGRLIVLEEKDTFEVVDRCTIDLGEVSLDTWRPRLSRVEEEKFRANVITFCQDCLDGRLRRPGSREEEGSTFNIRTGENGTVYKRVGRELGSSSFASVFQVQELNSGLVRAAKMPHFSMTDLPTTARKRWELIEKEFKDLVKLQHPHIVAVIDILSGSRWNEPAWLIMEYLPHSLDSFPLSMRDIACVSLQMMRAMRFMHAKDFTHRDLKPKNVLLKEEDDGDILVKIADFGSTRHDLSGKMRTVTGTSIYMAPELWTSDVEYTNKIDMWSLGIIIVEMLKSSGRNVKRWNCEFPPTQSGHRKWVEEMIRPRVELVPEPFRPLCEGLLRGDPESRWTAAQGEDCLARMVELTSIRDATEALDWEVNSPGSTIADPTLYAS